MVVKSLKTNTFLANPLLKCIVFSENVQNYQNIFFVRPKQKYFVGVEKFFDIPNRSEISCTFDCERFRDVLATLEGRNHFRKKYGKKSVCLHYH